MLASSNWNNPGNAALSDSALADAAVSDVLHFTGISSGFISFTYVLDGTSTQTITGSADTPDYWLIIRSSQFGNRNWTDVAPPQSVTLTAQFSGATLAYVLTLEAAVRTFNVVGTLGDRVDFLNTATLTGYQVFDSLGNPVNGVTITADSGFAYPAGQAAAPEPAAVGMVASALAALVAASKRRHRK